jgi:hypothetical protein
MVKTLVRGLRRPQTISTLPVPRHRLRMVFIVDEIPIDGAVLRDRVARCGDTAAGNQASLDGGAALR